MILISRAEPEDQPGTPDFRAMMMRLQLRYITQRVTCPFFEQGGAW